MYTRTSCSRQPPADELFLVRLMDKRRPWRLMSCTNVLYSNFDHVNFTRNAVCIANDSKLRHDVDLDCAKPNQSVFTARRYASAVYAVVVCPSVRLCLSSFLTPKISAEFRTGSPNGGAKWRCCPNRRFSTNIWLYLKNGA